MTDPNELPFENPASDRGVSVKMVGVGGAGSNAVDRLKMENLDQVRLAVINTDQQALSNSPVEEKVLIGLGVTRGLGTGGEPELGREAAEADREKIAAVVKDCDVVFLAVGMGGGTGGGAAPLVAEAATEQGALVIAFATLPFSFEGGRRQRQAEEGLRALRMACDAVIPLPNDVLLQEAGTQESVLDAFSRADEWIGRGVKSIGSILSKTGLINLDFATLRQTFHSRGGKTLFGLGSGNGPQAVEDAIESLKMCPLLRTPEHSRRADRLLVNIVGGPDLALPKVNLLMNAVAEQFGRDSSIAMGSVIDESMQGRVEICVLGTCDIAGKAALPRKPAGARARTAPSSAPPSGASVFAKASPDQTEGKPEHASRLEPKPMQDEIGFGEIESRGHFEKTDRNLFDGYDLDVPTYLRKGIKISL